jgi:hypothetical protein
LSSAAEVAADLKTRFSGLVRVTPDDGMMRRNFVGQCR